ncbi:MAG: Methyl-accepting chemotaxis sensory transducer [Candidatus Magnetoglobus multicellularis str. Araruama]|uniref:Methyl-accepting chemotaxis sensory transducer n=1 Tax=Candidatus Magnetoglobus multicellularis str. Araruama TaxID=890399 RepID=A0A1V1PCB7_9BACT|nr:MAG: Methyl-accepting chemotaxis sensory transducer [Candidatus Magnetoglobus multicellularis str. Araruama]
MSIHYKLTLTLLIGLVIILTLAQSYSYYSINNMVSQFSESNIRILEQREKDFAMNIFRSVEQSVAGSLERGEMEKFSHVLEDQKKIKGLLEFSLYSREGVVTHSSDNQFLNKSMSTEIAKRVQSDSNLIFIKMKDTIEIYNPQRINHDCIRCHRTWKMGENGGTTYFRFSTKALEQSIAQAHIYLSEIRQSIFVNAIVIIFLITILLVVGNYISVRVFVSNPLASIVDLLKLFKEDEGDLSRRIPVLSKDLIGQLAQLFNAFISSLNSAIHDAQKVAQRVDNNARNQASSIEEISVSVKEVAVITEDNVETANKTNVLIKTVEKSISVSSEEIERLSRETQALRESSDKTAQIIKTIDGIAFQTNLLALNAAVEAARAGEAGAGFAVVAEEVRNLALRTAESAKSTSDMIEHTIRKIEVNNNIASKVNKEFLELGEKSKEAMNLVVKIAESSQDQNTRIKSVNAALADVDQATIKNSSEAEELIQTMRIFKTEITED